MRFLESEFACHSRIHMSALNTIDEFQDLIFCLSCDWGFGRIAWGRRMSPLAESCKLLRLSFVINVVASFDKQLITRVNRNEDWLWARSKGPLHQYQSYIDSQVKFDWCISLVGWRVQFTCIILPTLILISHVMFYWHSHSVHRHHFLKMVQDREIMLT